MIGDFHLHSDHSDGRLTPTALIDVVADAGVQVAALTDHDTTSGVREAQLRARERGIHFIAGIEMTAFAYGRVIHVLGLGFDASKATLEATNRIAASVWDSNQRRWVDTLAQQGVDIDFERDFADHPVRLPVLIERLCTHGFRAGDPVKAHAQFREFFGGLPEAAYERLPSPAAAASVIRAAGGAAFVAHPYRLQQDSLVEKILDDVDGLEAMYLPYSDGQREDLCALAAQKGKLISTGSDYHGYFAQGYQRPPWDAPEALLRRLGL